MNKCWIVVLLIIGLVSCTVKDERYYRTHPKVVQELIKSCPQKQPAGISCQKLQEIATRMNELAYKLQYNPQAFGNVILKLQQDIANEQNAVTIENNKKELAEYLAIVKWLESPES